MQHTVPYRLKLSGVDIGLYFRQNELVINLKPGTTETMLFGTCKRLKNAGDEFELLYNNVKISFTETYKYLGNILDSFMS